MNGGDWLNQDIINIISRVINKYDADFSCEYILNLLISHRIMLADGKNDFMNYISDLWDFHEEENKGHGKEDFINYISDLLDFHKSQH